MTLVTISLIVWSILLFFQISAFYDRVAVENWTALMDTISVITPVPAILLIGVILLNSIRLFTYRTRQHSMFLFLVIKQAF